MAEKCFYRKPEQNSRNSRSPCHNWFRLDEQMGLIDWIRRKEDTVMEKGFDEASEAMMAYFQGVGLLVTLLLEGILATITLPFRVVWLLFA
jgi:hypothetical protein